MRVTVTTSPGARPSSILRSSRPSTQEETLSYRANKTDLGHGLPYTDEDARHIVTATMNKPIHIKLSVLIGAHTGARLSNSSMRITSDIELVEGV